MGNISKFGIARVDAGRTRRIKQAGIKYFKKDLTIYHLNQRPRYKRTGYLTGILLKSRSKLRGIKPTGGIKLKIHSRNMVTPCFRYLQLLNQLQKPATHPYLCFNQGLKTQVPGNSDTRRPHKASKVPFKTKNGWHTNNDHSALQLNGPIQSSPSHRSLTLKNHEAQLLALFRHKIPESPTTEKYYWQMKEFPSENT